MDQDDNSDQLINFSIAHLYRKLSDQKATAETLPLVSRAEWGAVKHTGNKPIRHPLIYVYLTVNTRTPRCANKEECTQVLQDMQKMHMEQGCTDIKYNFLFGDDGTIYEGRGWHFRPHTVNLYPTMDGQLLDFACIGNFGSVLRPDPMYYAQWSLMAHGIKLKYLTKQAHYW